MNIWEAKLITWKGNGTNFHGQGLEKLVQTYDGVSVSMGTMEKNGL
jgi:hypothetical protein